MLKRQLNTFDSFIRKYPEGDLSKLFVSPSEGTLEERFQIYATGYDVRTREALEEIFKLLPKLMGQKIWLSLGYDYVRTNPSQEYNLSEVGYGLPDYLRENAYAQEWVNLAQFEVFINRSFHAPNTTLKIKPTQLATEGENLYFRFQPAVYLYESEWNIAENWNQKNKPPKLIQKHEFSVIYRENFEVKAKVLEDNEYLILKRLCLGDSLEDSINGLHVKANDLSKWLQFWISHELIY